MVTLGSPSLYSMPKDVNGSFYSPHQNEAKSAFKICSFCGVLLAEKHIYVARQDQMRPNGSTWYVCVVRFSAPVAILLNNQGNSQTTSWHLESLRCLYNIMNLSSSIPSCCILACPACRSEVQDITVM